MIITSIFNPTLTRIVITSIILGFLAGSFGVFIVIKKQALVGDSLAHAALPGVVLAYMIFDTKSLEILLLGAAASAVVSMIILNIIKKYSKIKSDATLALILSGMFGLGIVLKHILQQSGGVGAAGVSTFIYGETASILLKDMYIIIGVFLFVNLLIALFWKEIKLSTFNPEFFNTIGFNSKIVDGLFSILIVIVVVSGIQMVGVVLISAILIAPAVAARQWSHRLSINFIVAGIIGALSGFTGALIGDYFILPAGPTIILVLSSVVLISLLFSPIKGVIIKAILDFRYKKNIDNYKYLINLYYEKKCNPTEEKVKTFLEEGFIYQSKNQMVLTDKGISKVKSIIKDNQVWV